MLQVVAKCLVDVTATTGQRLDKRMKNAPQEILKGFVIWDLLSLRRWLGLVSRVGRAVGIVVDVGVALVIARTTVCGTEAAVRKNLQRARATLKAVLADRDGGAS